MKPTNLFYARMITLALSGIIGYFAKSSGYKMLATSQVHT